MSKLKETKGLKGVFFSIEEKDYKVIKKIIVDRDISLKQFLLDAVAFYIAHLYR